MLENFKHIEHSKKQNFSNIHNFEKVNHLKGV